MIGVTPYAALQAQSFHTPSYSETDLTGGGFGLSYNAMSASDTRSELGARFDDLTMLGAMPLMLRARAAWAHDWVSNPSMGAVPDAAGSKLHGQRRSTTKELCARLCRRRIASHRTGRSPASSIASSPRVRRPTPAPERYATCGSAGFLTFVANQGLDLRQDQVAHKRLRKNRGFGL